MRTGYRGSASESMFTLLRARCWPFEIGSPKSPQLPQAQTSDKAIAGVALKSFLMDFHEGCRLLAVSRGSNTWGESDMVRTLLETTLKRIAKNVYPIK